VLHKFFASDGTYLAKSTSMIASFFSAMHLDMPLAPAS
jgi:hypothetical protein